MRQAKLIVGLFIGLCGPVTGGQGPGQEFAHMAQDQQGVYVITDQGSEFRQLRLLPLDGHKLSAKVAWDVETFASSSDGRYLLFVANEDGFSRLHLRDLRNGLDLPAPILPMGRVLDVNFAPDGTHVAIGLETIRSPREVWTYYVGAAQLQPPDSALPGTEPAAANFVDPQLIRYPTFDTLNGQPRRIPAFVYKPAGAGPFPVVIRLNHRPEVQHRPGYDPFLQSLVTQLGVAMVAPNVRGSSGYGRSYEQLDDGALREDAVKDVGALIAWLGLQQQFDRERIMVMGEAYGGHLALAALMHFGDRLQGGVCFTSTETFSPLPFYDFKRIAKPILSIGSANETRLEQTAEFINESMQGTRNAQ